MTTTLDWQGKVGSVWAIEADTLDLLLGPSGMAGLDALGDVSHLEVMDLGCGGGHTTLALADRGAKVTGLDISPDLMAVARARDPEGRANYRQVDAGSDDLGGPYEALYSRCGTMFFDNPVGAFTHIRSFMKPNAPMSLVAWGDPSENGWAQMPLDLAAEFVGSTVIGDGPGPFAWANQAAFMPMLEKSGWRNLRATAFTGVAEIRLGESDDPVQRAVDFAMRIGPMASRTKGMDKDTRAKIRALLYPELKKFLDNDAVMVPTKAWIIEGNA